MELEGWILQDESSGSQMDLYGNYIQMMSLLKSLVSEVKANATLSARGSIRRARDVATWLSKLRLLSATGLKADAVIQWLNFMEVELMPECVI